MDKLKHNKTLVRMQTARRNYGRKASLLGFLPSQIESYKFKEEVMRARYFRVPACIARCYLAVMFVCFVFFVLCSGILLSEPDLSLNLDYNQFRLNDDPTTTNADLQLTVYAQLSLAKASSKPVALAHHMPLLNWKKDSSGSEQLPAGGSGGSSRRRSLKSSSRKLQAYLSNDHFTLIYHRKSGGNLLTQAYLQQAYELEKFVLSRLEWTKYCVLNEAKPQCSSTEGIQSIFNYIVQAGGRVQAINFTDTNNPYLQAAIAGFKPFFDVRYSATNARSEYLLTFLTTDHARSHQSNIDLFNSFDSLLAELQDSKWEATTNLWPDLELMWFGGEIANYEFITALKHDLWFALLSFALVFGYGILHTGSLFLTFFGLLGVVMSFPVTILLTMITFSKNFGFMDIMSLWIMAGIGIDNIFVFLDAWKSTPGYDIFNRQVSYAHRLSTTYKKATPAMFSCTVTTGGAFFADFITSRITPISEFGFFMAIVIFYNYLMVMTWFPAVIICHEKMPFCLARLGCCYKKHVKDVQAEDTIRRKLFFRLLWKHSARRALVQSRGHGDSVKKRAETVKEIILLPLTTSPHFLPPHHTGKAKIMLWYGNLLFRLRFVMLFLTLLIVFSVGSQVIHIGAPEGLPQLLPEESNFEKIRIVQTAINVKGYVGGSAAGGSTGGTTGTSGNITFSEINGVRTAGPPFTPSMSTFLALYDPKICAVPSSITGPALQTIQSGTCNSVADCAPFPYLLPYIGSGGFVIAALPPEPTGTPNITCASNAAGGLDITIAYSRGSAPAYQVAALTQGNPQYWIAVPNTATVPYDVNLHVDPGLLRANQQYAFRVVVAGNPPSLASLLSVNTCAPEPTAPSVVSGLSVSTPASNIVNVEWNIPINFDRGLDLTGVELIWNGNSVLLIGQTPATSWSKTNALPQTQYIIQVRGTNSLGNGPVTEMTVTTPPPPPDPPVFTPVFGRRRRLLTTDDHFVHSRHLLAPDPNCYPSSSYPSPTQYLSWNPSNLNDRTGTTGGYQVRILTPSSGGFTCIQNIWLAYDDQSANPEPSCTVNVVYNTNLSAQVRVKNSQVWSNWSSEATLPVQYHIPEVPTNLRISSQDANGVTIAWNAARNNHFSAISYTISEQGTSVRENVIQLTTLLPPNGSPTSYTVQACNSLGCSPASSSLSVNPYVGPTPAPTTKFPTTSQPTTSAPTTSEPSFAPTTRMPSAFPTTDQPSSAPTSARPSVAPTTLQPTLPGATHAPTTEAPTPLPTAQPTNMPSTKQPSNAPSTGLPTSQPTQLPSTSMPTLHPTTAQPTSFPSAKRATSRPSTSMPTFAPSLRPTNIVVPTSGFPTGLPTTRVPSSPPTMPTPEPPSPAGGLAVSLQSSMDVIVTYGVASLDTSTRVVGDRASLGTPVLFGGFDPSLPASQIFLRDLCDKLLNNSDLSIRPFEEGTRCLFWEFAEAQPEFPVIGQSAFYNALISFLSSNRGYQYDVGFAGSSNNLTFVSVRALTRIPNNLGPSAMEEVYLHWKNAMDKLNAEAPVAVGSGYATADPWPQMAVENHFIESTKEAIIISLVICFTALAIFTENLYLAIYTTIFLMLECFFMLGVFGALRWSLGAVEAVSLSIIIGLSVDYFLHTAHWYSRTFAKTRKKKTLEMLSKIGFSILSAAAVAILACGVLDFCYLHVFARVGSIISATILAAVCLSLISLTALLFIIGPQYQNGWVGKCCRRLTQESRQKNSVLNTVLQLQILLAAQNRVQERPEDGQEFKQFEDQEAKEEPRPLDRVSIELQSPAYEELYPELPAYAPASFDPHDMTIEG